MREAEFLNTLCNTEDGVFITDENKRIIRWNRGAERILGYPETEAVNRECFRLLDGKSSPTQRLCGQNCRIHSLGFKGIPQSSFDMQTHTGTGEAVWINVTILSNPDHEAPFLAHILRDVTQDKRTFLALEQFLAAVGGAGSAEPSADSAASRRGAWDRNPSPHAPSPALSEREIEVLTLLAEGLSTKGLAQKLSISHFTARNHIQNILVKLNLHSKAQAVSYAFKKGIL